MSHSGLEAGRGQSSDSAVSISRYVVDVTLVVEVAVALVVDAVMVEDVMVT